MTQIQIVQLGSDGKPCASTEAIALGYKLQHKKVLSVLMRYMSQIETFGLVTFETRSDDNNRDVWLARLNERQASFLISLMRNTAGVVDFKLRMSHEFWRMGEALAYRDAQRDHTLLAQSILREHREGQSA